MTAALILWITPIRLQYSQETFFDRSQGGWEATSAEREHLYFMGRRHPYIKKKRAYLRIELWAAKWETGFSTNWTTPWSYMRLVPLDAPTRQIRANNRSQYNFHKGRLAGPGWGLHTFKLKFEQTLKLERGQLLWRHSKKKFITRRLLHLAGTRLVFRPRWLTRLNIKLAL